MNFVIQKKKNKKKPFFSSNVYEVSEARIISLDIKTLNYATVENGIYDEISHKQSQVSLTSSSQ